VGDGWTVTTSIGIFTAGSDLQQTLPTMPSWELIPALVAVATVHALLLPPAAAARCLVGALTFFVLFFTQQVGGGLRGRSLVLLSCQAGVISLMRKPTGLTRSHPTLYEASQA
jgi:hypothetical protein